MQGPVSLSQGGTGPNPSRRHKSSEGRMCCRQKPSEGPQRYRCRRLLPRWRHPIGLGRFGAGGLRRFEPGGWDDHGHVIKARRPGRRPRVVLRVGAASIIGGGSDLGRPSPTPLGSHSIPPAMVGGWPMEILSYVINVVWPC